MIRVIVLLLLLISSHNGFTQTANDVIKKASYLVANKRYESAFKLLNNFDPNNKIPDIVLFKEDIALNFYISTNKHQRFAFKDMAWNEDVMDYRGRSGSFNLYTLPLNTILDNLIKAYPNNYKLYQGLGNYYANVELNYDDGWIINADSLHQLIKKNYQVAIDHNSADDFSYYEVGYVNVAQQKYKDAIPYFLKSIALNKDNPDAYYNLAYAYLYVDDREDALKNAKTAYRMYNDSVSAGDAARIIGEIFGELKDTSSAIKYYELSDEVDSGNYNTLQPLLYLYVRTNKVWKLKSILEDFFGLDPENPTIYNDLADMFDGSKRTDILIDFYKSKLTQYGDDKKVVGNLYFYLGQLYLAIDKSVARGYYVKARDSFSMVYGADNEVFKAIEQGLAKTME